MNDRQRLEAIVAVVCKYLPPDGISREEAMSQIIALVDPLPEQPEQEPVATRNSFSGIIEVEWGKSVPIGTKLYTAPVSKPCAITDLLQQKFQSGNNVPVERVTITRSEYEAALRSKNNG